ncbi:MAG: NrfD/PsrC family molybdoenzyme membrane anchor subunit [Desulfobacca sp.]|uniref:NrfD/PsrC family molybdoenzyme membrane anchor subunit n=1 Tax=Desulfobacca sp. TaxID=2067990 RepID=UPI00404ABB2A
MPEKVQKWYVGEPRGKISYGRMILYILTALGVLSGLIRLFFGLGSPITNLSDAYPWGLWISFDVLTGVALAGGGFTMSAIIYVFNLKKFEPLLRPAKISAFLGYLMFIFGLFFDLGLPWRIWHPLIMWNPHSVLFEVAWCVMLYTTVLSIDVIIMALERFKMEGPVQSLRSIYVIFIVAGIILSTLHQSSLGALYLLLPEKMSELWATNAIGPLFFASAVIGGLSVVTLESLISAWAYNRKPELPILSELAKFLGVALLVYFAMKVTDLYARRVTFFVLDWQHLLLYVELFGTVFLPALLLTFREVRSSIGGLYWCAGLAAFGVALNRFNVSLTSYGGYREFSYFPSAIEIFITIGLIAGGVLLFDFLTHNLPVYQEELIGHAESTS